MRRNLGLDPIPTAMTMSNLCNKRKFMLVKPNLFPFWFLQKIEEENTIYVTNALSLFKAKLGAKSVTKIDEILS